MNELNSLSFWSYLDLASALGSIVRLIRSTIAKACIIVAALLLCGALFTSQMLLVGALDRLSIAPQHSFLTLNLLLITALTAFIFYPVVMNRWHAPHSAFPGQPKAAMKVTLANEPICKLLIVRRLAKRDDAHDRARKDDQRRLEILRKGDNTDEIAIGNWLCGS